MKIHLHFLRPGYFAVVLLLFAAPAWAGSRLQCSISESDGEGHRGEFTVEKELNNGRALIVENSKIASFVSYTANVDLDFQIISTKISDDTDKASRIRSSSFADLQSGEKLAKIMLQKDKDGWAVENVELYVLVCKLTE